MLLYNPNGILITYHRANKTASMLLSGYKCNNTSYCHSCLRTGLGFFWCLCLQYITYKYERKVSPLKNVLIIPFYLLRTPKLKFWNLGFMWSIGFFCYWVVFLFLFLDYVQSCLYAQSRQMPGTVDHWGQQNEHSTAARSLCARALGWRALLPPRDTGCHGGAQCVPGSTWHKSRKSEFPVLSIHHLPIASFSLFL